MRIAFFPLFPDMRGRLFYLIRFFIFDLSPIKKRYAPYQCGQFTVVGFYKDLS
ncbi:hypothetical protein HMPREF3191_00223 [Veillonellaceae bacterium DNF00626]|nr:hypothetical protein HMPREF3191_00223 [Veillonellaceae bacterium DNF00626]